MTPIEELKEKSQHHKVKFHTVNIWITMIIHWKMNIRHTYLTTKNNVYTKHTYKILYYTKFNHRERERDSHTRMNKASANERYTHRVCAKIHVPIHRRIYKISSLFASVWLFVSWAMQLICFFVCFLCCCCCLFYWCCCRCCLCCFLHRYTGSNGV